MKFSKRTSIIMGVMATLAMGSTMTQARDHMGMGDCGDKDPQKMQAHMQKHMEKRQERMLKKLNATDAQKQQIKAIMEANKPDMDAQMKPLMDERKALRDAKVGKDDPKAVALRAKFDKMHETQQAKHDKVQAQIRAVLTPEQAKTFDEMASKQKERMDKFREHRGMRSE